jgi:hypothetical protein
MRRQLQQEAERDRLERERKKAMKYAFSNPHSVSFFPSLAMVLAAAFIRIK